MKKLSLFLLIFPILYLTLCLYLDYKTEKQSIEYLIVSGMGPGMYKFPVITTKFYIKNIANLSPSKKNKQLVQFVISSHFEENSDKEFLRELLKLLMEKGHSINDAQESNHLPFLLLSIFYKDSVMFKFLLENGADPNLVPVLNSGHPWQGKNCREVIEQEMKAWPEELIYQDFKTILEKYEFNHSNK